MTRTIGQFGLRPAPLGHKWALQLGSYMDMTALPPIPAGAFGHMDKVQGPWGMLMNDKLGCCVVSGSEHCVMLWTAESGSGQAVFNDMSTVSNYELLGHYQPGNPDTDQGCDMLYAAEVWMRQGIVDATGKTHRIGAALELDCGPGYLNMDQFWYAAYYFDGLGLGVGVTTAMQQAFADGQAWDASQYDPNAVIGGHFVPAMARLTDNGFEAEVVTWGEPQAITIPGLQAITNTVLVYATPEKLDNGKDLEGLSWSDMKADIRKLNRVGALQGIHRL